MKYKKTSKSPHTLLTTGRQGKLPETRLTQTNKQTPQNKHDKMVITVKCMHTNIPIHITI